MDLEHTVTTLDQVLALVIEDTEEFPPDEIITCIQDCLDHLTKNPQRALYLSAGSTWMNNLKTIILRLLQTFKIDEKYFTYSFQLASLAINVVGAKWFESDNKFPILLCSLSAGRLRIIMEEPEKVQLSSLIPILNILEFFMDSIDDTNFFDDEQ